MNEDKLKSEGKRRKDDRLDWIIVIVFAVLMIGGCLLVFGLMCDGNGILTCIG